ncbi:MAG: hypothetical protein ACLT98_00085 [Eggerthellaceae bacterium]
MMLVGKARGRAAVCRKPGGVEGRGRLGHGREGRVGGRPWARDEVPVPNAEVLALMRMSIGKAEVFADVAEAYARELADGWTLPRNGRAYDTYRREYSASHTDGRYIMSLPKFLAAGNGLRFYDLRADLVDSGAVAAAEEKAAPSKAPTREQVRSTCDEKARRPRPGQSRLPRDRPR